MRGGGETQKKLITYLSFYYLTLSKNAFLINERDRMIKVRFFFSSDAK